MPSIVEPQPTDPTLRLLGEIAALKRRVAQLERQQPSVPIVGTTNPANAVGNDGNIIVGEGAFPGTGRLLVKVDGFWVGVNLS